VDSNLRSVKFFLKFGRAYNAPDIGTIQDTEEILYQFHKELVDDIKKTAFSLGAAPIADNNHRGIYMLVFELISVAEDN